MAHGDEGASAAWGDELTMATDKWSIHDGPLEDNRDMRINLSDLLSYTEWERGKWHDWFGQHGVRALGVSVGPHGDDRFHVVGDLVRHIFSAEKRYVERLSGRPLTETALIPPTDRDALFRLGQDSRRDLRAFITTFPAEKWDVLRDLNLGSHRLRVTPRKIVFHVVLHEIRHWAQVATLLRLQGLTTDFHDFLFSPAVGGESAQDLNKE